MLRVYGHKKISKYGLNSLKQPHGPSIQCFGGPSKKRRRCNGDVSPQDGLRDAQMCGRGRRGEEKAPHSGFKAFLINASMQRQVVATYKYGRTLKWGVPGGWGQCQPRPGLIPDIYFCLFSLRSEAPREQFLL